MPTELMILAQPRGLMLRLSADASEVMLVELQAGGLTVSARVWINPAEDLAALREFLESAATGSESPDGRWEYKGARDENFVLHAEPAPNDAGGAVLSVDLLATAVDDADWELNGTILVPLEALRQQALRLGQPSGPAA